MVGKSEYTFWGCAAPGDHTVNTASTRQGNVRDGIFVTINVFVRTMGYIQGSEHLAEQAGGEMRYEVLRFRS